MNLLESVNGAYTVSECLKMAIMLNAIIQVRRREAEGGVVHSLAPLAFVNSCTALRESR